MNPLKAYTQHQARPFPSRIDMLLALYDGAIERLEKAIGAMRLGDEAAAMPLLLRAQAIVMELAAGVNVDAGDPNSPNLLCLYEYFAHSLATRELSKLESVVQAMATLREGFRAIRPEALRLEREGGLPGLDAPRHVLALV